MSGFAASFEFQPHAAFVSGDDLEASRLANYCQIGFQAAPGQGARSGLRIFFIHKAGENDFCFSRPATFGGQLDQCSHHHRDRAFGIACAAAKNPAIFLQRNELAFETIHGIEMRRKEDALSGPSLWWQANEQIRAIRENLLKFYLQTVPRCRSGQELGYALFSGPFVSAWQKSWIHAGQRDQLA